MTDADVLTQPALALVVPALGRRSRSASRPQQGRAWHILAGETW